MLLSGSLKLLVGRSLKPISFKRCASCSQKLIEKEKEFAAGNYAPMPCVVLCRGEGIYVWDVDGKKYMDFFAGFGTVNMGHSNTKIVSALTEQACTLSLTSRHFHNNVFPEYAEKIAKFFCFDQILSVNTGVEACEAAWKLARKWGYKVKGIPKCKARIIFCEGNFSGGTLAALSASTNPGVYKHYGPYMPGFCTIPYNDPEALENMLQDPDVCAFMVEPMQVRGGLTIPEDGYLKCVREICTKSKVLFIANEVQTGIGRTGAKLAVHHEDVEPDILVLGKGLSGGMYPVSCILANQEIMCNMEPGGSGSTFGGNPLGCRVAIAALCVLEKQSLCCNAMGMGKLFRASLEPTKDSPVVCEVRGKGLLNAIELNPVSAANFFRFSIANLTANQFGMDYMCVDPTNEYVNAKCLSSMLKECGILTRPIADNSLLFAPPLIICEEEIKLATETILSVICKIENEKKSAC